MVVFVAKLAGVSIYRTTILRVNAPSVSKSRRSVTETYEELAVVDGYYESRSDLCATEKPAKALQKRKIRARWDLAKHRSVETTTKTEDGVHMHP